MLCLMKQCRNFSLFTISCLLSACSFSTVPPLPSEDTAESSSLATTSSSSLQDTLITRNVNYTGVVEEMGIGIVMQGTHLLRLLDSRTIFLSSTDANLDLQKYIGKNVELRGSVQPTVEGNAILMRVEQVTVLDLSSSSSSSTTTSNSGTILPLSCSSKLSPLCPSGMACVDALSDACDPESSVDCPGMCSKVTLPQLSSSESSSGVLTPPYSSSSSSSLSKSGSSTSSHSIVSSSSSANTQQSSSPSSSSANRDVAVALLAKQDYSSSLWTQKYCTSHIGFCVPVHKNWFFKSFGATTTNLWHIEFDATAIDILGDGLITLNLVAGTSAAMNASDGEIRAVGDDVIAFRDWKGNQHFEIIAPAALRAAAEYMLSHLERFAPVQ